MALLNSVVNGTVATNDIDQVYMEYVKARERLEKEFQRPTSFGYETVWKAYEKAYFFFCAQLTKTDEKKILKNRRCGSTEVLSMRYHILQRSKYLEKSQECKLETNLSEEDRKLEKFFFGDDHEDSESKLVTFLALIRKELKKWSGPIEPRTMIEELMDLVPVDEAVGHIEKEMQRLMLTHPEESLEIMEKKTYLVQILERRWNTCTEQIPIQFQHLENYKAFRANWQGYLLAQVHIPPEREMLLLKQLFEKPELEVARSVDEIWKVLDFTYGQDISIIPIQKARLKNISSVDADEDVVMLAVLRPEVDPPIATHAVQLHRQMSFKEQRSAFPCVRSCKKVDCDHNVLVFNGMVVEEDATPLGLGMEDRGERDVLGIVPRFNVHNEEETDEIVEYFGGLSLLGTIINRTQKAKDHVSVGLNIVLGDKEGGFQPGQEAGATSLPPSGSQCTDHQGELFSVYLGPVRNATPDSLLSCLPIVQFQGAGKLTSVGQLVDNWCLHTREHLKRDVRRPTHVMYNNKRCNLKVRIMDLELDLRKLYFSLPLSYRAFTEDERDIEQLLDFIEGDNDGKSNKDHGDKKKKRKKKKVSIEGNPGSAKSKAVQQQTLREEAILKPDHTMERTQICLERTRLDRIEDKEVLLQRSRDFMEEIVEVKGKEMAKLITVIESIEDERNDKLKEKSVVEMQISDLRSKHEKLVHEIKTKDEQMVTLLKEKRDLEAYIENSVLKTKKEITLLEEDMKSLKIPPQTSRKAQIEATIAKRELHPNLQLLQFIDSKIEAKEQELECPVCFEIASPPIFMCTDLHLICSDCRPKVKPKKLPFLLISG